MMTASLSGLAEMRARIDGIRAGLHGALVDALGQVGDAFTADLQARTPIGQGDDTDIPAEGDAPGRLRDSYEQTVTSDGMSQASLIVQTTQPQKLSWVVNGRGDVYPVNKQALFWKALGHPIGHAGPSQPNDFVTPITEQVPDYVSSVFDAAITALLEGA